MRSEADAGRIAQTSSSHALGSEVSGSRRLLVWAQTDVWGQEVSATRRLVAWLALAITLAVAVLLAVGS